MLCLRNCKLFISFRLIFNCSRSVHKVNVNKFLMDNSTVYFRMMPGSERFQVLLPYKDTSLNIEREFNFDRRLTEPVEVFLGRMKCNVEKLSSKKQKKKKDQTISETHEVTVELLKNEKPVPNSDICKDVFFDGHVSDLRLRLNSVDYVISVNCPWVNTITLPISIMANFPVFPAKLEFIFSLKSHSLYNWYRAKKNSSKENLLLDSVNWENVGSDFIYTPCIEDIGYHLKLRCIPSDGKLMGPPSEAISTSEVGAGPGHCPFEDRHAFTSTQLKGNEFRIASYNILADVYAETEEALNNLFSYCPRYALSYDYRRQLLIKEIVGYNADILCLQEVDDFAFQNDLNVILTPLGYSGCYSQKGGTVREGVACFYLQDRFECKNSHTVILADELQRNNCMSDIWECISKKEALKLRVIERHTALQVIVLKSKENPNELLVIGNTHLYFHPDADHVRLLQAGIILKYLTDVISKIASDYPDCHVSLLISGDFNSSPDCGIYKLMTKKHVPKDFIDWKSNLEESVEGLELNQPWNLGSACGSPKFTNFTSGFADCLDYIFYQTDRLVVNQVVPLPSEEELRQHTALPSVVFPSDHIAIVADLSWINSK